jgi:AraC-like DNA-binding protein
MAEQLHIPTGRLAEFVQFLWYSDDYRPVSARERVLPTGHAQLVFNLDGVSFRDYEGWPGTRPRELGAALVSGVRAGHGMIDATRRRTTIGALLRPGAVRALMGMPASALNGETLVLGDLWREDMEAWTQRLREAGTVERKLDLLASWLRRRLDTAVRLPLTVAAAVEVWDGDHGRTSVAAMVDRTGYSRRRFVDLFKDAVGVTPKTYARLRRFQQVLAHAQAGSVADWAGLALDCGYCDQAHLIQDFRQFAGVTPVTYARAHPLERNHLAL